MRWMLLRAELRARWRAWLAVTLLIALGGAFVLTAAAGARRTASSFTRFQEATRAPDLVFAPANADEADIETLRASRGVAAVSGFSYFPVVPATRDLRPFESSAAFGGFDPSFGNDVYRYLVLEGRRADQGQADEVTVNRELAELAHLRVGDRVGLRTVIETPMPEVTVVGIHRGEFDVGPAIGPNMLLTAAWVDRYGPDFLAFSNDFRPAFLVRSDPAVPGARAAVGERVSELFGDVLGPLPDNPVVGAIRVQSIALTILALVAGLATVVTAAQSIGRTSSAAGPHRALLGALGLRRRELVVAAALPALLAALLGGVAAAIIAFACSGIFPTGLARLVEPEPGLAFDRMATVISLILAVAVAGVAVLPATLRGTLGVSHRPVTRPRWIRRVAPSVPAGVGLQAAVMGYGAGARAQARAAISAVATAVVGVTAVLAFGSSQQHMFASPDTFGFTWTEHIRPAPERLDAVRTEAMRSPSVDAVAAVSFSELAVDDAPLEAFIIDPLRGQIHPTLLAGRAAAASDEIVLPPRVHPRLRLGSTVHVESAEAAATMRVVGRAVFPGIGPIGDFNGAAAVSGPGATALGLEVDEGNRALLVRLAKGHNDTALLAAAAPDPEVVQAFLPPSLVNLRRAGSIPTVLGIFLALLGAAGLLHALLVGARAGRRTTGVLRALGCTRRQVRAIARWQASATSAFGLLLGVPLGLVVGRAAWVVTSRYLGVAIEHTTPVGRLAAVAATAAALGLVSAAAVSRRARPAAQVLRSE